MTQTSTLPAQIPCESEADLTEAEAAIAADPDVRARIDAAKKNVDLMSQASILSLGAEAERDVATFADTVLDKVMARDTGDAHEQLAELKAVVEGLDTDSLKEKRGFFARIFYSFKRELDKFSTNFMTAREQVDAIAAKIEDEIYRNRQGLVRLDSLFEQTEEHFKGLSVAIEAAKELRAEWTEMLPELEAAAAANAEDQRAMQRVRDTKASIELMDRKQMNLEKSRAIAFMHMPAIRQVQQTGVMLIQEMNMMVTHAVPAWKTSIVINIEQVRQRVGLRALSAASDFTNAQITNMANTLEENTTAIHEQSARGIAEVDAIVNAMGTLVNTLNKVDSLADDARKARESGRARLKTAQEELSRAGAAVTAAGSPVSA